MMARISRVGQRFGRLIVESECTRDSWGNCRYLCRCDCGSEKIISAGSLTRGATRSCGCLAKEETKKHNSTHGMSSKPEYKTWVRMKTRCYNKKEKNYSDYGGRGIKICKRWRESFDNFYVDMGEMPQGKSSIDRIDNNGDYTPDNCRWADNYEQARNKRSVPMIEYSGENRCLAEWSEITGIKKSTIHMRINTYKWTIGRSLGFE